MRSLIVVVFTCLSLSSFTQINNNKEAKPIKLLVVTGGPTLKHHIDLVPTSFYRIFMDYQNLDWDHASHDEAAFQSDRLHDYDAILMYNRSDTISEKSRQNIRKYLEAGKGLVVLHHALGSYNNWEWWWKKVVGGKYQMKDHKGISKSGYNQEEKIYMSVQKQHFISEEIQDFELIDEAYNNLWISQDIDIIYKTDNQHSDGPTVWISPFKLSKVVIIQPGHAESAHLNKNYKSLLYRAIEWVSD